MKRVVIIGGGIAGLSAAYSILEHKDPKTPPVEIIITEKNGAIGGNIRTERVDGFIIEGGPDCFLSEKPWAMELCKRIGLGADILTTNEKNKKTFILSGGRLHEMPEGVILMVPTRLIPLAFSSLITIRGKIRMSLEYFIPRRKETTDETLGSFVRRRLGKEVLEKIAEPLVAGVHAGDPETMSVRASFPKFVQMEEDYGSLIRGMLKRMNAAKGMKGNADGTRPKLTMFITLKDGLGTLIDELRRRLDASGSVSIKTNLGVSRITKDGGRYSIKFDDGTLMDADALIVATPAHAAAGIVEGVDAALSERLRTIPYVSTATISLGYKRKDVKHPLDGFGFVVPGKEGRKIMAASWTSVKFKYRAPDDSVLIRCFVGGARNASLVELNDAEMLSLVRSELKTIMGIEAAPVISRIYRWRSSMPQYTIGHEERVAAIEEAVKRHDGMYLTGSAYHGIGISDSIRNSEIAAKKALHHVYGG